MDQLSASVWDALLSMAALSTALAYVLYFAILVRAGTANLLLFTLLIPPFARGLGVLFLGKQIKPEAWIGFAITALGFVVTDGRLVLALSRKSSAKAVFSASSVLIHRRGMKKACE